MKNKTLLALVGILLLGLAGFYLYKSQFNKVASSPSQTYQTDATNTSPKATLNATSEREPGQVTVEIMSSGFEPPTVNIKADTKVVWENKSGKTVSINSADHPTHLAYPPLNLGIVKDGESVSFVFDAVGTYKYHDHLNPSWVGTVVVE